MMGVKPSQMAEVIGELGVDLLGINCGHSLEDNFQALEELRGATDLPIWFKPNAGLPTVDGDDKPIYDTGPEAMGDLVPSWVQAGAKIIGGCCGTSPKHLHQIAINAKK